MATRAERAAEAEAKFRTRKEALTREITRQQAVQRNEDRKARDKRRYLVGKMVDEAGLFALDDATLLSLITDLGYIGSTPNPVALMASFVHASPPWDEEGEN